MSDSPVRHSINRKLTLMVVLTTGASLFLACLAFVAYDVVTVRQQMARNAVTLAEVIGINSGIALTFDDRRAATETLGALSAAEPVLAAAIYDRDGKVFARYITAAAHEAGFVHPPVEPAGYRFEKRHLELFRSIVFNEESLGTIYIRWDTVALTTRIQRYLVIVLMLLVAASAMGALISVRLHRQISRPLAALVEGSRAIADGDLSTRVVASSEDDIGVLGRTYNAMAEGLRDLVEQVRRSTRDVSEVATALRESSGRMATETQRQQGAIVDTAESLQQVSASIHDVNEHVEVLAEAARSSSASILEMDASIGEVAAHMDHLGDSIDTTSAAVNQVAVNIDQVVQGVDTLGNATDGTIERLEQLALSVRQVSINAAESHTLSEDSTQEASHGMAAVNETIVAMGEISSNFGQLEARISRLSEKSQAIDEIIQVIQDVAEQTSLLSLNAAIIAAQAGEHGKPFSVVADQVKSLASRTQRSTEEISELIRAVQAETAEAVSAVELGSAKVEKGVRRSNEAGEVLEKIIEKSQKSTARVREISQATATQTGDLERLNDAMAGVKGIVEQIQRSTREQHRATSEIAKSVGNIRLLGGQVRRSTDEQRRGSRLITESVTEVAAMIDQIAEATKSQAKSNATIEHALHVFRDVTDETTRRAEAINAMVATLSERSEHLEQEIDRFKTE
jgi:methyl-accepting chemotaxis protein